VYHCENWHASNCTETEETWAGLSVSVSQKVRIEWHERSQELIDERETRTVAIAEEKKERELCVSPAIGLINRDIELMVSSSPVI